MQTIIDAPRYGSTLAIKNDGQVCDRHFALIQEGVLDLCIEPVEMRCIEPVEMLYLEGGVL